MHTLPTLSERFVRHCGAIAWRGYLVSGRGVVVAIAHRPAVSYLARITMSTELLLALDEADMRLIESYDPQEVYVLLWIGADKVPVVQCVEPLVPPPRCRVASGPLPPLG